jgi:hypothetical protein
MHTAPCGDPWNIHIITGYGLAISHTYAYDAQIGMIGLAAALNFICNEAF